MHGQAHHDASQSTNTSSALPTPDPSLPYSRPIAPLCLAVEPDEHSTATHDDDYAARRTATVHSARTASTTCVDPHPKTLWSTAPLKSGLAPPHPLPPFSLASSHRSANPACLCGCAWATLFFPSPCNDPCMTTKPTTDFVFLTPAPPQPYSRRSPSILTLHSLMSIYVLSIPYLPQLLEPLIFRPARPRHYLGVRDSLIARR